MSIFTGSFGQKIADIEKMAKKFNTIKPADFKEYVDTTRRELLIFCDSVESMTSTDRASIREQLLNSKSKVNQQYEDFVNHLRDTALRDEKKNMFSALTACSRALAGSLDYIIDNTETLFNDKAINLYNTRVSQVGIMGVIHYATVTAKFATFMMANVTAAIVKDITLYPYRTVYVDKNMETVSSVVNDVYKKTGYFAFLNGIGELKKRNLDAFILDDDGKSNSENVPYDSLPLPMKNTFIAGLFGLNIFRWIGETWNSVRHAKYMKLQQEREWMVTHVNLMKMVAARMDPNSEEYRKKIAIIEKYNEMIAKLDQKLNDYFKED